MSVPVPLALDVAFAAIDEPWSPRIAAELNGQHVKVARLLGEFVWHAHADADELFLVRSGRLTIEFRDGTVQLGPGELVVVPRGVEHRPVALEACEVLLFEPAGTVNTGDVEDPRTRRVLPRA
ncbi:MAG: cupin domain-containing protein [Kofleriaceae bacterium]